MLFGVILSIDAPRSELGQYLPRRSIRCLLQADIGESDYRYLGKESDRMLDWLTAVEWKGYCVLNRVQFQALVDDCGLYAQECETLGSLGVPWAPGGMGLAPAISFTSDEPACIVSCYVTPLPNRAAVRTADDFDEWDWRRVRAAVINEFGTRPRRVAHSKLSAPYRYVDYRTRVCACAARDFKIQQRCA